MATHLQIVNRVLRRLREDTVTGITDNDYSELIAEFVLDVAQEVNDALDWESLKHTVHVDLVDGTSKYDLTAIVSNGGNVRDTDARVCKIDSELQFIGGDQPQVWLFSDDSDAQPTDICYLSPEAFREYKHRNRTKVADDPEYFTIYPEYNGTNERLYVELYPEPNAARVLIMRFYTSAPDLAVDGTTDATEVLLPDRPIFLGALMLALNERGEEIGEPGNMAERKYINALSVAMERDIAAAGKADRYDWRRD